MDFENILNTIQPFIVMFMALFVAFLTATWISAVLWTFRDIRSRTRDIFAQALATLLVFVFFPLFPVPGLILYVILRPRETLSQIYERSLEEEVLLHGIEERLACPGCNRRIETDYVVCPSCHTRLKKPCPSCGRLLHLQWHICAYCGAAQTATREVAPGPQPVVLPPQPKEESPKLVAASQSYLPEMDLESDPDHADMWDSPLQPAAAPGGHEDEEIPDSNDHEGVEVLEEQRAIEDDGIEEKKEEVEIDINEQDTVEIDTLDSDPE
jgi:RNA polymerase subunit RPABC4/transcription elongation factor Spt4